MTSTATTMEEDDLELSQLMSRVTIRNAKIHGFINQHIASCTVQVESYYDGLTKKIIKEKRHALKRINGYKLTYVEDLANNGNLEQHKFPPKVIFNPRHIRLARMHTHWGYYMSFGTTLLDVDDNTLLIIIGILLADTTTPVHPRIVHVTKTPSQLIALKLVCRKTRAAVEFACDQLRKLEEFNKSRLNTRLN